MGRAGPGLIETMTLGLLLALSPAGYFAGYMMPDIFLPLALLALLTIGLFWSILSMGARWFWSVLLIAAMLFHNLNIALVTAMFILLILMRAPIARREGRGPALLIAGGIAGALAAQAGVTLAVRGLTGATPVSPPFLAARLIADGPGRAYLTENCPQSGFELCRHLGQLSTNSDLILWSGDPQQGLFWVATPREKRRIADEQLHFALAVAADRPGDALTSTTRSVVDQLRRWRLSEFNYAAFQRGSFVEKLPEPILGRTRRSAAFAEAMPTGLVALLAPFMATIGLAVMAALVWRERTEPHFLRPLLLVITTIFLALLLNAIICGAISTPHDRYQMRLVWLLPMLAAMLAIALRPNRRAA
jgi:hypothetical protein